MKKNNNFLHLEKPKEVKIAIASYLNEIKTLGNLTNKTLTNLLYHRKAPSKQL